jgi:hypothetical protein
MKERGSLEVRTVGKMPRREEPLNRIFPLSGPAALTLQITARTTYVTQRALAPLTLRVEVSMGLSRGFWDLLLSYRP